MALLTQEIVEKWVSHASGIFWTKDIWSDLDIASPENRAHLRVILERLCDMKIIARTEQYGKWRRCDTTRTPIIFEGVDPKTTVPLYFPFEIERYARIRPKSIIIVAGGKNSGKTAFAYNFINMNYANNCIDLYSSETGAAEIMERMAAFPDMPLCDGPNPYPFGIFEHYKNFADVIDPKHISVIDYLYTNSEYYNASIEIDSVFHTLTTGVALIIMQKPPDTKTFVKGVEKVVRRDLAYGGGPTAWHAYLYIVMDGKQIRLKYVKSPVSKTIHPDNMTWNYQVSVEDGVTFTNITRSYENEES